MRRSAFFQSYQQLIRWPERLFKGVAWLVIVCFCVNCITPAVVAAKSLARDANLYAPPEKTKLDLASDALITLEETLDRMNRRLTGQFEFSWQETLAQTSHASAPSPASRTQLQTRHTDLTKALATLDAQQPAIQSFFTQAHQELQAHGTAAAIVSRHQTQMDQYAAMYATLKTKLAAITSATTDAGYKAAVADATTFLHAHSSKPKRAKFDPNHLAFGPPKERARQALTDAAAIQHVLQLPDAKGLPINSGKTKSNVTGSLAQTTTRISAILPNKNSSKALAAIAGTTAASVAKPKDLPANLSPSEDVQITPAIQAEATALGNNPLRIYQFVRNSVEYLPTYGSIQGSDYTLQTLRGNDIDQASLLIALLRAANIPAHYVYGTIQVPIAQVENWVGGVTDPNAALDLMGQGGIPILGLAQGGVIQYAQIEHVWVEAQIGFAPSRGAVTTSGTTWVPMDPSYKQYAYTAGMNLQTNVPFDATDFVNTIQSASTINASEGWVQNVDQTYVNTQLTNYQTQLTNYVTAHNASATVGDVIGTKTIQPETLPLLAASLPYTVTATASRMDTLTDTLRWAFHYQVDGNTLLSQSLPSLAGHLLALSFDPATPQDEATLESYIPPNITNPSQLPTSLPAGIVNLTSEFSIDGLTIATGPMYSLGASLTVTKGLYQPNIGWQDIDKPFTAGDYQAVGLDGAGVSQAQVTALQTQLQATQTRLQAANYTGLTKHDLTGATLQASISGYFLKTLIKALIAGQPLGIVTYRLPSFGSISTNSTVSLFFGVPVQIAPDSALVDMDRLASSSVQKANDVSQWKAFNKVLGSVDSLEESGLLESQFSTPQQPVTAVSAVQAQAVANLQNQRIYTINVGNEGTALAALSLPNEVIQDIADAISAGNVVTTSQAMVNYASLTTVGYIVIDPTTGGGAYKIATGADGAVGAMGFVGVMLVLLGLSAALLIGFEAILSFGLIAAIGKTVEALIALGAAISAGYNIGQAIRQCDAPNALSFSTVILLMFSTGLLIGIPPAVDLTNIIISDMLLDVPGNTIENVCGD